jgi:tetratricopeptide (TPR) repeat protein
MAKQGRAIPARSLRRTAKTVSRRTMRGPGSARPVARPQPAEQKPAPTPPPPPKKPAYYEAIALYESGVRALQRHDFLVAADAFRNVVLRYPEERELLERARLYLRVCERETAQRPTGPQTTQERVYAATVALNAGDSDTAFSHLRQALEQDPNSDHAHYIMAVALVSRSRLDEAVGHLQRAIALNPDNRSLARTDADLDPLRELDRFRILVDVNESAGAVATRKRPNRRR